MIRNVVDTRLVTRRSPKCSVLSILMDLDATFRQRRVLAGMEAHRLADIGISRSAAIQEASTPFWSK